MIGFFDSGKCGLSVAAAVRKLLPHYSYLYLPDSENGTYGQRTRKEITQLTKQGVTRLFNEGCNLVILACNSASACALRTLQQEWLPEKFPDKKLLGILVPTIEQITGQKWTERNSNQGRHAIKSLAILATPATIASGAYEREIKKRAPKLQLIQQPCPGLADLIENDADDKTIKTKAAMFIQTLFRKHSDLPDALLLGCTHYSLKHDLFETLIPPEVELFDQPTAVAKSLQEYLKNHPKIAQNLKKEGLFQQIG